MQKENSSKTRKEVESEMILEDSDEGSSKASNYKNVEKTKEKTPIQAAQANKLQK